MDPLEAKVNTLFSDNSNLPKHLETVNELKLKQGQLETRLDTVEKENVELKQKLTEIEDQMLETCIVLTGLPEEKWEDPEPKHDADWVLSCRKNLNKGIFVDKQYSEETEYERKCLRPILSAARRLKEYRGRCKLEGTTLVIRGKKYPWNNLSELPQDLNTHSVSSRQNATHYGFFGELNPLSNFYLAPFVHDGIYYTVSEQYIQARKAEFCGDMEVKHQILEAKTAIKCKSLGKEFKNCNIEKWNQAAEEYCYPGILRKFQQNAGIASFLKNTGTKTLLECCYDDTWGNGLPLSNPQCINPSKYKKQGILGAMLECVRDSLTTSNTSKSNPDHLSLPVETTFDATNST